jgi:hypothetical protein
VWASLSQREPTTDFLSGQLDYLFLAHGLAFVLLASTARALAWSPGSRFPWRWLGVFALGSNPILVALHVFFMIGSCLALFEFGRRTSGGSGRRIAPQWVLLPLVGVALSGWWGGAPGAEAAIR